MIDKLLTILEEFNYPVYRQGTLAADEPYPETFITFWNPSTEQHSFYDNEELGEVWSYIIYVYSSNPGTVYTLLKEIRTRLKQEGFIPEGFGFDVASDEKTHTGRAINVQYLNF